MAREATDQLYIELGYFTPEEYYVYVAIAQATPNSSFSLTAELTQVAAIEASADLSSAFSQTTEANKIATVEATISSAFTQSATISHIEGADLFAFSDAQIAALVDRIRDYNISTSTAFDIASDYIRVRLADSAEQSEFSISSSAERSRQFASQVEAAFSFACTAVSTKSTAITLSAASTVSATGRHLIAQGYAALVAAASLSANANVLVRNTTVTVYSGGAYDTFGYNAVTKKFGSHAGEWTIETNSNLAGLYTNLIHDGTNFKIFNSTTTYTSSDGLTWTSASSTLGSNVFGSVIYTNGYYAATYQDGSGIGIRYSTNGTSWSNNIADTAKAVALNLSNIGNTFYLLYINQEQIYRRTISNLASGSFSSELSLVNNTAMATGNAISPTDILSSGSYIVWASLTNSGARVYRYNGTTLNTYTPGSGTPVAIGYNNSAEFVYQRVSSGTYVTEYSTNTGTNWSSLDIGTGNRMNYNAVYANSNWLVPTLGGLYTASSIASITKKDADSIGNIVYASSKYLTFDKDTDGHIRYSSNLTSWSSDLIDTTTGNNGKIVYESSINDFNDWGTLDFWAYTGFDIWIQDDSSNYIRFTNFNQTNTFGIYRYSPNLTNDLSITSSNLLPTNQWNHIRIQNYNGSIIVFVNGVYKTDGSLGFTFSSAKLVLRSYSQGAYKIDELLLTDEIKQPPSNFSPLVWNTSTFTVPDRQWMNDSSTDLLVHFNNTAEDDSRFDVVITASLVSIVTISAILSGPQRASATINSTATVSAQVGKLVQAQATLQSECSLTAVIDKFRLFEANLSSQSTQTTVNFRIRDNNSSLSSAFNLDGTPPGETIRNFASSLVVESLDFYTDPINLRGFDSAVTSQATVSIQVAKITGYASTMAAVSTQAADVTRILQFEANIASAGSQLTIAIKVGQAVIDCAVVFTATIDAVKSVAAAANITSNFSINAIPVNTYTVPVYLNAVSSLSIELGIVKEYAANYNTNATVVANVTASTDIVANVSSAFNQISVFDLTRGATSNQSAAFNTSINYTRKRFVDVYIDAVLTQNTQANATFDCAIAASTAFALGCTISHIEGADLVAFSNAALTIDAFVGKVAEANVNANASISADLLRIRSSNSSIVSAFSTNQNVNYVVSNTANAASAFICNVIGNLIGGASSNIQTQASVNCTISHIESANLVAFSNAAVTTNANRLRNNASTITASAAISLTATKIKTLSSSQEIAASISCAATKVITANAAITSNANVTAQIYAIIQFNIVITDAMTFSAGVREIDFDSVLQEVYKIPRETWTYKIAQETRLYKIGEETRIYEIRSS